MRFPPDLERQVLVAIRESPDSHITFPARAYEHGRVMIYRDNLGRTLHRHLWEQVFQPIPAGRFLRRMCENARCVNPHHYALSTASRPPAAKCPNGHRYTADNTVRDARGVRHCRICGKARRQRYQPPRKTAKRKGWCAKGLHKLTDQNTYKTTRRDGSVSRRCKPCHLERVRAYRQENR